MIITLHTWTPADKPALMALCNAVDRTYLSDRLPYPYTEADADWWLGMVTGNDGKEGVWRAIVVDGQVVGSISVERMANENRSVGSIGYMIIGEVFPENLASARVLEKNGFRLEETKVGAIVKSGKAMDVREYCYKGTDLFLL